MDKELEIDIVRCIKALIHRWWLIVLATICTGMIGLAFTMQEGVTTYSATSSVYSAAAGSYTESLEGSRAMQSYYEIATSLKVCEKAAQILDQEGVDGYSIMAGTGVTISEDSNILYIYGYSMQPETAIEYSKALANAFVMEMQNITGSDDIQILDEAYTSTAYDGTSSNNQRTRLIALAAGFVIACIGIVLAEIFRTFTATIEECTLGGEIDIIGVIPFQKK